MVHVQELTQPQGHSTSGSHERYKNAERLAWETTFDCIVQMKKWMIEDSIATVEEIEEIVKGENYVILPLFGYKNKQKFIFEHSGLNQWNANGRERNVGEIYIPIPIILHQKYPNFFPERDHNFNLQIPTGEIFSAKVCQQNSKALMTNPNKALSEWLLRRVLLLEEGELATMDKLDNLGFDSVIILKDERGDYKIDIMKTNSFEKFFNNEDN